MTKNIRKYMNIKKIALVVIGSMLLAASINYFISPVGLYTGGLSGVALIIETLSDGKINFSISNFVLNFPLLLLSWFKLGKRFTFYTIISVVTLSVGAGLLPEIPLISDDLLLMSLFGGIIAGVGTVLTLKAGGSCAGVDIIALYMSERSGKPLGNYALMIAIGIFSISAILFDLEIVLFTLIGAYATTIVIDKLHTRYNKLSVTVITNDPTAFIEEYQGKSNRGITILDAVGAYTGQNKKMLYVVITSYELTPFIELVKKHDPQAFINVSKSTRVFGSFYTPPIDDM